MRIETVYDLPHSVRTVALTGFLLLSLLLIPTMLRAQGSQEMKVHYPIIEIGETGEEYVDATIALIDGVAVDVGAVGSIYLHRDDALDYARTGQHAGTATIVSIDGSTARIRIAVDPNVTSMGWTIVPGDLIEIVSTLPAIDERTIASELAALAIAIAMHEGEMLFDARQVLLDDSDRLYRRLLETMDASIDTLNTFIAESGEDFSELSLPLTTGPFAGKTLITTLQETSPESIDAWLRYIVRYPAYYFGQELPFHESYLQWLMLDAPYAENHLAEILLALDDPERRKRIASLGTMIVPSGYLDSWIARAETLGMEGRIDEGKAMLALVTETRELLKIDDPNGWVPFVEARLAEFAGDREAAIAQYEKAIALFTTSGDNQGLSSSQGNLASIFVDIGRYDDAYAHYTAAIDRKRKLYDSSGSYYWSENLANALSGRARGLVAMGRYEEGIADYRHAGDLYYKGDPASRLSYTAWALVRIGSSLSAQGLYRDAIPYLDSARGLYRENGDQEGEADALDEIGYSHSGIGEYREAIAIYDSAYTLHMRAGEKADAGFSKSNIGQSYWSLGDYYNAEKSHREALILREEAEDLPGQAYSWHKLGAMFAESGNPNGALDAYAHATELYSNLGDLDHQAEVLVSMGDLFQGQKAWRKAIEQYDAALAIQKEIGATNDQATTMTAVGNAYLGMMNNAAARLWYERSRAINQEIGDRQNLIYSLTGLALVEWREFDYEGARTIFTTAQSIAEEIDSKTDIAWIEKSMARVDDQKGEADRSLERYMKALTLYREIGERSGEIEVLLAIGYIKVQRGRFEEALSYFRDAETLARESNYRTQLADAMAAIADVHRLRGESSQALAITRESLAIQTEVDNAWGIAAAHLGLGNTYNSMGHFSAAIREYELADSIYLDMADSSARGTPINNIGTIWYFQGDYDRALANFNEVLKILRATGDESEFLAIVVGNIGEVYYHQGRLADAEIWVREGLALAEKVRSMRIVASDLTLLTETLRDTGRYKDAEAYGRRALALSDSIGEPEQIARINGVMGRLEVMREDDRAAERYLKRAVEVATTTGSEKYIWQPLYDLGIIERERQNRRQAIEHLTSSIAAIESLRSRVSGGEAAVKIFASNREKIKVYEALIGLLIEEGEIETALGYLERSSNEDLRARFTSLVPTLADPKQNQLLEEGREMRARIDKLAEQLSKEQGVAANREQLDTLRQIISIAEGDYITFVNETIRKQPDLRNYFSTGVNPIELRQRKSKIPDDVAVVSYLLGETQLFTFVATRDTVIARVVPVGRKEIARKVYKLYSEISAPQIDDPALDISGKVIGELYGLLIEPVADRIAGKARVAIITSGDLAYLPFGVLRPDDRSHSLIDDVALFYISDLGVFLEDEPERVAMKLVAFGNADETLPSAEEEVNNIAALYPGSKVYVREEATEDRAKAFPAGFNALHFATHGTLDYNDFEQSWLTLAENVSAGEDGHLTLNEIWSISNLTTCTLVTLSACNTAVSEELVEGWPINPANAFLQIGVPRVVATLWQVDDEATAILMLEFYRNLETKGAADALSDAQRTLASTEGYTDPYYWAPFILLGDWR